MERRAKVERGQEVMGSEGDGCVRVWMVGRRRESMVWSEAVEGGRWWKWNLRVGWNELRFLSGWRMEYYAR